MPKESHERRYYQSFRPFSPFSDAEALEDGKEVRMFKVIFLQGQTSSRAREFYPHPLTEPCVKVSPHTTLHTLCFVHRHNLGV